MIRARGPALRRAPGRRDRRRSPSRPTRVLELGIGTGETSRRLLDAHPDAEITGLDSSPEMVFHARELGIEVRLGRMEDPLPDGPWDLVIAVLSVHHLRPIGKRELLRRVREQSRSLVIGDVVTRRASGHPDRGRARLPGVGSSRWPSGGVARSCGASGRPGGDRALTY